MEADGVGPREDRAGLDDRRADEGDGEDHAHRPDEAIESDADPCGGGGRLVGGIGRRGLFRSRHEDGGIMGCVDRVRSCSHFGQTSAITRTY